MNKKRLLILNGSHSEIPLIQAAKDLNFYVITTGNNPNLIGHSYANEYHLSDFSDYNSVLELSKKIKIDAVCACANDFGAITASFIAEQLNLPGHDSFDTTLILHHKDRFKKFALSNDIPTPYAESYSDPGIAYSAYYNFTPPIIIKPIDLTGGKGISKVSTFEDYKNAVNLAFSLSPKKRIVVEKFVDGTYHSFSTFIVREKVVFYFSDNEFSFLNPYLVSTSAAPATNVSVVANQLIYATEKIANLLSLKDGVFHIQYVFQNDKAYILEITRRCSGDLYPYPVNYATGLDWAHWIVKAETGLVCSSFPKAMQKNFCGRHCIMSSKNGIIKNVIISDEIKNNIYDSLLWWKKGDQINNYLVEKAGIVFLKYRSMEEMQYKTQRINSLIYIEIE